MADPKETFITSVVFCIHDEVGALQVVLGVISKHNLNMTRIESRPSTTREFDYDFFVDFSGADMQKVMEFTDELRRNHLGEIISIKTTNIEATTSKSKVLFSTFTKIRQFLFMKIIHNLLTFINPLTQNLVMILQFK